MDTHIENQIENTETFSDLKALPGKPYPLGAHWDGEGANFAVFSENAACVELCLFDEEGREFTKVKIEEVTHHSSRPFRDDATMSACVRRAPTNHFTYVLPRWDVERAVAQQ